VSSAAKRINLPSVVKSDKGVAKRKTCLVVCGSSICQCGLRHGCQFDYTKAAPHLILVNFRYREAAMPGSIYGVFVGIDQYAIRPLQFCCGDAVELHRFFAGNATVKDLNKDLRLLTFPVGATAASVKNRILQELEEFADGQYYLVMDLPMDIVPDDLARIKACSLSLEKLRECVDRITTAHQILIIDACRDELTPARSRSRFTSRIDDAAVMAFSALKERKIGPDDGLFRERAIVSSCWQGQKSWESEKVRHGWFTYHLLEHLKSQTVPINLGALVPAVKARMKEMIHLLPEACNQTPHMLFDGVSIFLPLRAGTHLLSRVFFWCCFFDLAGLLLETGPLFVLVAGTGLLAAALWSSSASELALVSCLSGFLASMALYGLTVLTMMLIECRRIIREQWLKTVRGKIIRISAQQNERLSFDDNSDLLMIILASLDELAARIKPGKHPSRLLQSIERIRPCVQTGIATGAIAAWFVGGLITRVQGVRKKFLSSSSLHPTCFWMPLQKESVALLRAVRTKQSTPETRSGRQTKARIKLHLPSTVLGINAGMAWTRVLGLALLILLTWAGWSAWILTQRPMAPVVDGEARWWLRSKAANREQVNRLRLDFSHLDGNPAEYFVVAEGQTRLREAPVVTVRGRASLAAREGIQNHGYAMVPIRAVGATVDPRFLVFRLQRQRSILGVALPPQQVKVFGITKVNLYYDDEQP
jgi:hypothetical protein